MMEPRLSDRRTGHPLLGKSRPSHRGAMALGLGVSAALHVLVIIMYAFGLTDWSPREGVVGVESVARTLSGMRVVQVVEIASPDESDEATEEEPEPVLDPVAEPLIEAPGPVPVAGPEREGVEDLEDAGAAGVRAADQLRVVSSDPRLWRPALPAIFELTEAERIQLELAGRLEEWNDSVIAAMAAESALTDWTVTDDQGNRWGFSPGQIHLGSLTLPLPFAFGTSTWQRERAERRAWEDADILNNLSSQAARASWEERARAIRERKDRQRREAEEQSDSTSTQRAPPPPRPPHRQM